MFVQGTTPTDLTMAAVRLKCNEDTQDRNSSGSLAIFAAIRRASFFLFRIAENSAHSQRLDHRKLALADAIVDVGRSLAGYAHVDFHLDVIHF